MAIFVEHAYGAFEQFDCTRHVLVAERDLVAIRRSELKLTSPQQVRYAATEILPSKSARARGAYLRVSFKNTRETAQAINGWKLQRAVAFLENVKEHKEAVPMRRYAGSTGRCAQGTTRNPGGPALFWWTEHDANIVCSGNTNNSGESVTFARTVADGLLFLQASSSVSPRPGGPSSRPSSCWTSSRTPRPTPMPRASTPVP